MRIIAYIVIPPILYILRSLKDKRYYVGYCSDLQTRLKYHNEGHVPSTKNRRPLVIIYFEQRRSKIEAIRREKEIKSYKGGNAFKKLLMSEKTEYSSDG
ncbi:GIY-YIG nuclease family protein [Candidatus Microgenomates bacterium]|nr:GIY-YIG nuclease family protein [Candidatus Microgenomates bacterium]